MPLLAELTPLNRSYKHVAPNGASTTGTRRSDSMRVRIARHSILEDECCEKGSSESDHQDHEINCAAHPEFDDRFDPSLPVDRADRQKNLNGERDPQHGDQPPGQRTCCDALNADREQTDQYERSVGEAVDMQGVNQVIYIED